MRSVTNHTSLIAHDLCNAVSAALQRISLVLSFGMLPSRFKLINAAAETQLLHDTV